MTKATDHQFSILPPGIKMYNFPTHEYPSRTAKSEMQAQFTKSSDFWQTRVRRFTGLKFVMLVASNRIILRVTDEQGE